MTITVFASGQSNMLGRGTGGPDLSGVSADVRVWDNVNPLAGNGSGFVSASAAQAAGTFQLTDRNNLAVWFCDKLARTQFDDVDLTLVARASSPISYWDPGEATYPMLDECIDVWTATGQGPADIFIWHQGENNSGGVASTYRGLFVDLLADLTAGGVIDADTLVIVGGILGEDVSRVAFNQNALAQLQRENLSIT